MTALVCKRAQPAEMEPLGEVQFGPHELCRDDYADQHAHDPHTTVMMANWRTTL